MRDLDLARRWIREVVNHGFTAVKIGHWPACRAIDYHSSMAGYIALLRITREGFADEVAVLSLSNVNAAACNLGQRILRARDPEDGESLFEVFAYQVISSRRCKESWRGRRRRIPGSRKLHANSSECSVCSGTGTAPRATAKGVGEISPSSLHHVASVTLRARASVTCRGSGNESAIS